MMRLLKNQKFAQVFKYDKYLLVTLIKQIICNYLIEMDAILERGSQSLN